MLTKLGELNTILPVQNGPSPRDQQCQQSPASRLPSLQNLLYAAPPSFHNGDVTQYNSAYTNNIDQRGSSKQEQILNMPIANQEGTLNTSFNTSQERTGNTQVDASSYLPQGYGLHMRSATIDPSGHVSQGDRSRQQLLGNAILDHPRYAQQEHGLEMSNMTFDPSSYVSQGSQSRQA